MTLVRAPDGQGGEGLRFSVEDLGQEVCVLPHVSLFASRSHAPLPIFYLRKPAHFPLPSPALQDCPGTYCVLPFQGTKDGVWHDGPLAHIVDHQVQTWIPEGYPVALTVPIGAHGSQTKMNLCAQPREFCVRSLIGSLVTAIRIGIAPSPAVLMVKTFNLSTYVQWVLLAKAYPELAVSPIGELDFKQWPSAAKRICQNLGWSRYERLPDPTAAVLDLTFIQPAADAWACELAAALNVISDVIPRSLLARDVPAP